MKQNRKKINILIMMSILFIALIGYLTYFDLFVKETIIFSSNNRRQWEREDRVLRGSICDRTGMIIAQVKLKRQTVRSYPLDHCTVMLLVITRHNMAKHCLRPSIMISY
jgi:peptidoglycan glycosyltransferase